MRSFVEWADDPNKGFIVSNTWDYDKGEWSGPGRLLLREDHQRRILEHCLTPDEDGQFPYTTIVYSTPKKEGKSTLAAAVASWGADELDDYSEIFICASSQEQGSGRVFRDVKYHVDHSVRLAMVHDTQFRLVWPNETFVHVLTKNYKSAAGSRHAIVVFDELWGFLSENDRRMWGEMTPIPTVPVSIQFIATYAGWEGESDLLWDIYKKNVGPEEHDEGQGEKIPGLEDLPCWRNGRTFIYWDHERRMPWQTDEEIEMQLNRPGQRASEVMRHWFNEWVANEEEFIPIEWWDQACSRFEQDAMLWVEHPYRHWPVWVAVDAAPKKDSSAVVGVTYDSTQGKVVQLFHKIWTPAPGELFDFEETIEKFLLNIYNKFNIQVIGYDPAHLHQTQVRLRAKNLPMFEINQRSKMRMASQAFYDVLKGKNYWSYPDPEMRDHIRMAVAEVSQGSYKIVKDKNTRQFKPVDAAVAAAMAVWLAVEQGGAVSNEVIRIESSFSDVAQWKEENGPSERHLPFPLRSD